jgi:hypothetical protein
VPTPAKRALGAVLALVGLGLCVVGAWFTVHLGTSGTATFTLRPAEDGPVVIGPGVINRVALPVTIRARAAGGAGVWIGVAAPTDARSAVDKGALTVVDGVSVRDWALLSRRDGSGAAPELVHADLWRQQAIGKGSAAVTLLQASAPETVVITGDGGKVDSVTLSLGKKTWFVQSLLAALSGLLLAVAGVTIAITAGRPPGSWESLAPEGESRRARGRAVGAHGRTEGPNRGADTPGRTSDTPGRATEPPGRATERPSDTGERPSPAPGRPSRAAGRPSRGYQPRRATARGEDTPR